MGFWKNGYVVFFHQDGLTNLIKTFLCHLIFLQRSNNRLVLNLNGGGEQKKTSNRQKSIMTTFKDMHSLLSKHRNTISIGVFFVIALVLNHGFVAKRMQKATGVNPHISTANFESLLLFKLICSELEKTTNYYEIHRLANLTSVSDVTNVKTTDNYLRITYWINTDSRTFVATSNKLVASAFLRGLLIFIFGAICREALNIMYLYVTKQIILLNSKIKAFTSHALQKLRKEMQQLKIKTEQKTNETNIQRFESVFIKWSKETLATQKELKNDINTCLCLISNLKVQSKCEENIMKVDAFTNNSPSLINKFAKPLKSKDVEQISIICENCQATIFLKSGEHQTPTLKPFNCSAHTKRNSCQIFQVAEHQRLSNNKPTRYLKPGFFIGSSPSSTQSTSKLFDANGKPYRRIFVPGKGWISRARYFGQS